MAGAGRPPGLGFAAVAGAGRPPRLVFHDYAGWPDLVRETERIEHLLQRVFARQILNVGPDPYAETPANVRASLGYVEGHSRLSANGEDSSIARRLVSGSPIGILVVRGLEGDHLVSQSAAEGLRVRRPGVAPATVTALALCRLLGRHSRLPLWRLGGRGFVTGSLVPWLSAAGFAGICRLRLVLNERLASAPEKAPLQARAEHDEQAHENDHDYDRLQGDLDLAGACAPRAPTREFGVQVPAAEAF